MTQVNVLEAKNNLSRLIHLLAFSWHEDCIVVDVFHALTDATGAMEVVRTLLYYYCSRRLGNALRAGHRVYTVERAAHVPVGFGDNGLLRFACRCFLCEGYCRMADGAEYVPSWIPVFPCQSFDQPADEWIQSTGKNDALQHPFLCGDCNDRRSRAADRAALWLQCGLAG